jgi:hypothetical protein
MPQSQHEAPSSNVTSPPWRVCRSCLRTCPLQEFRRRAKDSARRMHNCSECHTASERARRQKQAEGRKVRRTVQRAQRLAQARRDRELITLASSIVRTIGPNRFATDLREALDHARTQGHYRDAKQLLLCIARLAEKSEDLLIETMHRPELTPNRVQA